MSVSIPTLEETDCILLFGYNPAASHPIVARRIVNAKERGADLIVCDPRVIESARIADMYLPLKNGSNLALLNGGRAGLRARGCGRGHGSSVRNHPPGGAPLRQRRYGCHRLGDGRDTAGARRADRARHRGVGHDHRAYRHACERACAGARPEQRARQLRHGHVAQPVSRLPARERPCGAREVRSGLGCRRGTPVAQGGFQTHRPAARRGRGHDPRVLQLR